LQKSVLLAKNKTRKETNRFIDQISTKISHRNETKLKRRQLYCDQSLSFSMGRSLYWRKERGGGVGGTAKLKLNVV